MRPAGIFFLLGLFLSSAAQARAEVDYVREIKPLFKQHCYSCHSALRQQGGLRLDHVSFVRTGGDSGAAIGATPAESLLLKAIEGTGEVERMPLEAKPLSDEHIALVRRWIEEGAKAPEEPLPDDPRKHWSFQKPVRPALPAAQQSTPTDPQTAATGDWTTNPIDRFIAAGHQQRGLVPAGSAPKHILLRRVYLDLIGLPPSPSELRAFASDDSADAYEKVVDRLLASPRYGERWGRHWMDVWRYSDWDGYGAEVRESQPHIWRWRDWIIESLNSDKPYDEMIVEMLAADEVAPLDANSQRATGFLARNWFRFNRNTWLEAAVEHTGKAFLGVTMNCARCHDHMYDPILQTDYYQFRAFFEPHNVRADRVPGQSDTKVDGLVRAYDAEADKPTFLFVRGNEASPDKEHPLVPGVPAALGGDSLALSAVPLPAAAYYPGLRPFVQQEALTQATTEIEQAEAEVGKTRAAVDAARKAVQDQAAQTAAVEKGTPVAGAEVKPAEVAAAKPADNPAQPPAPSPSATLVTAERAATVAESRMLAAAANLVAVRAKITADNAAFATPPSADAAPLARDASRAERVANMEQARHNVTRLEKELEAAKATTDEAVKKKVASIEAQLTGARKVSDTAQAALGQPSDTYTRFTAVYPATSTGRRAALARWIASKNNPLTARVAINHIWLRHFGSPLVPTVFDFGLNGQKPTHPELLDWLSIELMDESWRMKGIHRLIVTSQAYRLQSSGDHETNRKLDPENAYLWRGNPRRIEAEVIRDSTLQVADGLDATMYGAELPQETALTVGRRSIYFRSSKEKKVPFLDMFDRANVTDCYRRSETIVPQQALAMVNSSLTLAQGRRLAEKLSRELNLPATAEGHAPFIDAAFERVLCRSATEEERTTCLVFLAAQARRFSEPASLVAFTSGGENAVKPATDPVLRARENLVHVLLNHNDFLTVR